MNKRELVEEVAARTSGSAGDPLTTSDVEKVLDAMIETITLELVAGGKVQLVGFGSFDSSTRTPTNPQTGEKMATRRVPVFKAGSTLKDRVKAG